MVNFASDGHAFQRDAPATEADAVHRFVNVDIAHPAILAVEPDGGVKFLRVIQMLRRGLDVEIFNADLREPRGRFYFDDSGSRRVQVFGIKRIGQRNVQRDFVPRQRSDPAFDGNARPRANPRLRFAVACQVVHAHELDPGGRDRSPDFNRVADRKSLRIGDGECRRTGRNVGVSD